MHETRRSRVSPWWLRPWMPHPLYLGDSSLIHICFVIENVDIGMTLRVDLLVIQIQLWTVHCLPALQVKHHKSWWVTSLWNSLSHAPQKIWWTNQLYTCLSTLGSHQSLHRSCPCKWDSLLAVMINGIQFPTPFCIPSWVSMDNACREGTKYQQSGVHEYSKTKFPLLFWILFATILNRMIKECWSEPVVSML
jgi:hypothetical protein